MTPFKPRKTTVTVFVVLAASALSSVSARTADATTRFEIPAQCTNAGLHEKTACSERMAAYDTCVQQLDRAVDAAADEADAARLAVEQLKAMLSDKAGTDAAPLQGALSADALKNELTAAQGRYESAKADLIFNQQQRDTFGAETNSTCAPRDAIGVNGAISGGAGQSRLIALNLSYRQLIQPRLSMEFVLGYVADSNLIVPVKTWGGYRTWILGARLRHGRENLGALYWGPNVALDDRSGDLTVAAGMELGFSLSPARTNESWGATDFRFFLQPWLPLDGRGAVVLFGFGFGLYLVDPS